MKPRRLLLAGFRGIKDGIGLDTFELDLERLDDARLIAIAGANGRGKTTVLDNLHPYPLLPSRTTGYGIAGFSMYDHVIPPEGRKELDWEHQGRVYRSSMVWRSVGRRRASEAYLSQRQGDQWAPVRLPDGTISDGKIETYNRLLLHILGSPAVFFSSQFSAQGRRKLFEYRQGELKQLLVELLDLGELRRLGMLAQEVTKGIAAAAEALRAASSRFANASDEEALNHDVAHQAETLERLIKAKVLEDQTLIDAHQALAVARARADQDTIRQARERIQREMFHLDTAEKREMAQSASLRTQMESEIRGSQKVLRDSASGLQVQRNARITAIQAREALLARRPAIREAADSLEALAAEILACEQRLALARQRNETRLKIQGEITAVECDLRGMRDAFSWATQALAEIRDRARLASEVPCVGTDLQPRCKLLKEALEAIAKTPASEARLVKLADEEGVLGRKRNELEGQAALNPVPAAELAHAEAALRDLRQRKEDAERLAALAPSLEGTEREVAELKNELAAIEAEHLVQAKDRESRMSQLVTALKAFDHDAETRFLHNARERQRLQLELKTVGKQDLATIEVAEAACQTQAAKVRALDGDIVKVDAELVNLRTRLAAAEEASRQREAIYRRSEELYAELAYWKLLAKAFGNEGLIAMLIDEAGPSLAGIANDLLLACYGCRFTVSIATQRNNAGGEPMETFDLLVHDADSDEAKSLAVMSGGERVWINEALTRAIALYMARGSDRRYQTLFCDESDGPLDSEHKVMFVQMQRKVLELGGYDQAFFITQSPELLAYADHVIEL